MRRAASVVGGAAASERLYAVGNLVLRHFPIVRSLSRKGRREQSRIDGFGNFP